MQRGFFVSSVVLMALLLMAPPVAAQALTISRQDCQALIQHQPDTGVEYRPGQDSVNGQPVVPADLPGSAGDASQGLVLDQIQIDIQGRLGAILGHRADAYTAPGFNPELSAGTIVYDLSSRHLTFNGRPLPGEAETELLAICQDRLKRAGGTSIQPGEGAPRALTPGAR